MKQINLIEQSEAQIRQKFVPTEKNKALMLECFEHCYKLGLVNQETINRVRSNTNEI